MKNKIITILIVLCLSYSFYLLYTTNKMIKQIQQTEIQSVKQDSINSYYKLQIEYK